VCSNRDSEVDHEQQLEEVGPPVQGVRVRIDDDKRLWVAGDGVMQGYWGDSETTRTKLIDGWLDTGDQAEWVEHPNRLDASPSIRILGRMDDTIVLSSGYKIQPLRIEQLANRLECIEQCLLVGNNRPYPILLVRPALCLPENELAPTILIQEQLARQMAGESHFSVPRQIVVIQDVWSYENQLANFKGAALRKAIEKAYSEQIEAAYRMSNDR
jgi:long-chain acyl-CoA synthetase